jgi:hypothetical protein
VSVEPAEIVRREAIDYVDAVVARAEGVEPEESASAASTRSTAARIVPGFVKRSFVRSLIYLLRHPFDHLAHPMEVEAEHQGAELRAAVHAAHRRADQAYHAVQRGRPELESWRRAAQAAIEDLEQQVRALQARIDDLERGR